MKSPALSKTYFASLLPELATRAARASVSRLGFSNPALRQYLQTLFSADLGERGCFVGEPVFEATFGWESSNRSLRSLVPSVLSSTLVDALDKPAGSAKNDYRLPDPPYKHQLEAWELLGRHEPHSVIVTSGTGSGKTECFMVPILDQLARSLSGQSGALEGVQALFLYPLNALIKSQQERLHAWTEPFNGDIRFCLYNGLTPERPEPKHARIVNQVTDRTSLRTSPPPILVTNATMLEYMLVRALDAPIMRKSKGKLRWIVLDEAHSYIGSQAAELSLLLRRVLDGFGVQSADVRFVATSATIGDPQGEAGQQLRGFLADLAGVSPERVHVVAGYRAVPMLPGGDDAFRAASLADLEAIPDGDENGRFDAASGNTLARGIRRLFVPQEEGRPANPLSMICDVIHGPAAQHSIEVKQQALRWLDLLTRTSDFRGKDVVPFLPLRLHAFHNVLAGLWACCDTKCAIRNATALDSPDWGFGVVYTEQRDTCDCGAPVYELRTCNECNETYLWAHKVEDRNELRPRLLQDMEQDADDFQLETEATSPQDEEEARVVPDAGVCPSVNLLIANSHQQGTADATVECGTQRMDVQGDGRQISLRVCDQDEGTLTCPECGGHHGGGRQMFRSARLGAPFLLMQVVPTLLEYCPDGDAPLSKPLRGRRMITFTDSRQGTARMSAALQRDAERNSLRSLVYHKVASPAPLTDDAETARKHKKLRQLRALDDPDFAADIAELERQLAGGATVTPISFNDLSDYLAQHEDDVKRWAFKQYREMSPAEFADDTGPLEVARLFLFREFSRRPKRANSLETMGLVSVQYPKLDKINAVPAQLLSVARMSPDEWRQLLKVILDFVVRENSCLEFKPSWRKWVGKKSASAQLLPPESKDPPTGTRRRWPHTRKMGAQNRLVRLLAATLSKDPTSPEGRDVIDVALRAAWDALVHVNLLRKSTEGRYLALDDLAFAPISNAWLCPVTRRVLDTAWRGITPYLPGHSRKASSIACQAIRVPQWEDIHADFDVATNARAEAARAWLSTDADVINLRSLGLWSNLNDRVVEGVRYYRAAEHSAQQPGHRLSRYEREFKEGQINLLSCSTTMEMGVDIGGISVVAMNNVPPHPANYLQRAGRAGRRSETRSIALTVCKNNPHDQRVFADPMWPFTTKLPAPVITLESTVIVQRHVNAMLLSDFLWQHIAEGGSLEKLNVEWWALPVGQSRADAFMAQARCFDEAGQPGLVAGLRMLLKGSCFDHTVPLARLAENAAAAMKELLRGLYSEIQAIDDALLSQFGAVKADKEPAYRALTIQRKRLTGEYLLRELACGGFLPGYGFPTNITSFDTLNKEELDRQRAEHGREDNKMRRRDLPSRDAVTALREYAPGADVVIDGTVYRSAGITLNWHTPASESQVKEIQSIRQAWRCRHCGASGSTGTIKGVDSCLICGTQLGTSDWFTYIEPAGFAVNLYEPTHTDVSEPSYVPVSPPWINAQADWLPLPNPALGSYRSSSTGTVFNHSAGVHGNGYAICLECGRAEPMPLHDDPKAVPGARHLPKVFQSAHSRLRGGQGGESRFCKGSLNAFSIKPWLHLGLEEVTDVLEVLLNGLDGLPMLNSVAAFSIAVALRNTVAAELGVEIDELGCDTKPIRRPEGGIGHLLVLYDHSAAGYCSSVADRLPDLLRKAQASLKCPVHCKSACQHCLSSYDTRFRLADLDRNVASEFLSTDWMQRLQLQPEDALFGQDASQAESQSLPEAVTREWDKADAKELRLFLRGSPQDWDLAASPIKRFVQRWAIRGPVKLVLTVNAFADLSSAQSFALAQVAQWDCVSVHTTLALPPNQIAEVLRVQGHSAWACRSDIVGVPAAAWGLPAEAPLVRGRLNESIDLSAPISLTMTVPTELSAKAGRLEIRGELNARVEQFGDALLRRLEAALGGSLLDAEADIKTVIYRDRYLNAPLAVSLLLSFIAAIKTRYTTRWDNPPVEIVTVAVPEEVRGFHAPTQVFHNWLSTTARDAAIRAAFDHRGMTAVVRTLPRALAAHARMLEIEAQDGRRLKVWFDQGFGYWSSQRAGVRGDSVGSTYFNFSSGTSWQGEEIGEGRFMVEGQSFPTQIFFEKG